MATYNGADYLEQQLESIRCQSHNNWEILVRDDGSTDSTLEILQAFQRRYPQRMTIVQDDLGNLGSNGNFFQLMGLTTADYVCMADQDDIWHIAKIEAALNKMYDLEAEHGNATPLLVHHDVVTIDMNGIPLSASYARTNNVDKTDTRIRHLLVQNIFTGFTMMLNRNLIGRALPAPADTTSHDAYLGLIASTFGHVGYVDRPLANYRIHPDNIHGGKNFFYNITAEDFSLGNLFNGYSFHVCADALEVAHSVLGRKCDRASSFLRKFSDDMPEKTRHLFEEFTRLADANFLERKLIIIRNGFFPTSRKLAAAFLALG